MSFSSDVKEELLQISENSPHCRAAALAAVLCFGGKRTDDGLYLQESRKAIATKCFTLLQKTLNINSMQFAKTGSGLRTQTYITLLQDPDEIEKVLSLTGLCPKDIRMAEPEAPFLSRDCCRRTFLRNAFCCCGSVSDPKKEYHLEFGCSTPEQARLLTGILEQYGTHPKAVMRRKNHLLYLKDSEEIIDVLNLMGATAGLMEMENSRILKEVRNSVNRRVNCETANINKTVEASRKQVEDIEYLQRTGILKTLPDNLIEAAILRIENEDLSLTELGKLADPPIGKSGMNHRLRKLSEIAEKSGNVSLSGEE